MHFNVCDEYLHINVNKRIEKTEGLRTKYGEHVFDKDLIQKYEGQFLYNNIHGQGKYTCISPDGNDYLIQDSFYSNKIHGYSTVYYNNGGLYEGLFKLNKRYGPGVFTNENGRQDVGLWDGLYLIRLCCPIYKGHVPKLAISEFGKVKLLKYRKLVPVCCGNKMDGKCTEILKHLHAPKQLIDNSNVLYNEYVRNENSLLFDKELYDELFFGLEDRYIDVISEQETIENLSPNPTLTEYNSTNVNLTTPNTETDYLLNNIEEEVCECEICEPEEETDKTAEELLNERRDKLKRKYLNFVRDLRCKWKTTKMRINSVLAWNNENHLIEMLRYCFRFRKMETNNVSFNVQSLLTGYRNHFNKPGKYEEICRQFLINCSENNYIEIMQFSNDFYINPDLCDSFGNTGMMFAAAKDSIKTLEILLNLGGKVDSLNDEGLTPLTMCLLRYIATLNDVNNWEKAFVGVNIKMDRDEMDVIENWCPNFSLINLINCKQQVKYNYDAQEIEEDTLKDEYLTDLTKELRAQCGSQILTSTAADECDEEINKVEKEQDYLFDFDCLKLDLFPTKGKKSKKSKKERKKKEKKRKSERRKEKSKKGKEKKSKRGKKKKVEKEPKENDELKLDEEDQTDTNEDIPKKLKILQKIENTIKTLLRFGADLNVGEVPLPPLILSIFTLNLDIIKDILKNKPTINVTTLDDNLTALHVLVSLKPPKQEYVDIIKLFLENNANPNFRCSDFHWPEEKINTFGTKPESQNKKAIKKVPGTSDSGNQINSEASSSRRVVLSQPSTDTDVFGRSSSPMSKCPLHIISLRYDYILDNDCYLNQMANLLLRYGANANAKYLGHTPLTLAILRGNTKLIETLLMNGANPNDKLDQNMGVPSTVLILKRYENLLPSDICEIIYEILYKYHVNPLKTFANEENAIDFMTKEHEIVIDKKESKKKKDKKGQKNKKKTKKQTKKQKKLKKGAAKSNMEDIKSLLMNTTKKVLEKFIKSKALSYLYLFIKEDVINVEEQYDDDENDDDKCDILNILAKFLNTDFCVKTFQLFIHSGRVDIDENTKSTFTELIDLVKEVNPLKKHEIPYEETEALVNSIDWNLNRNKKNYYEKYVELDNDENIYKVCFNCLTKQHKQLFPCPICGLIYFCSQKCNISNNRIKNNLHPCKVIFYNDEKAKYDDCIKNGIEYIPFSKLSRAKEIAEEKIRIRIEEEIKRKLLEAEKKDHRFRKGKDEGYNKGGKSVKHGIDGKHKQYAKDKARTRSDKESKRAVKTMSKKKKKFGADKTTQTSVKGVTIGKTKLKGTESMMSKHDKASDEKKWKESESKGRKSRKKSKESSTRVAKKSVGKGHAAMRGDSGKSSKKKSRESSVRSSRKSSEKYGITKTFVRKTGGKTTKLDGDNLKNRRSKTQDSDGRSPHKKTIDDKQNDSTAKTGSTYKSDLTGQKVTYDLSKPTGLVSNYGLDTVNNYDKFDRLPTRYEYFMNNLLKVFPDIDLSTLLLPYACYKDGELYYRFKENKYICSTYSHI